MSEGKILQICSCGEDAVLQLFLVVRLAPVAHMLRISAAGLQVVTWQGSHEDYFMMLEGGQLRIQLSKELIL
jgi:hypothetical protein